MSGADVEGEKSNLLIKSTVSSRILADSTAGRLLFLTVSWYNALKNPVDLQKAGVDYV